MKDSSIIVTDENRKVIASISSDGTSTVYDKYMLFEIFDEDNIFIESEDGDIYLSDKIEECDSGE